MHIIGSELEVAGLSVLRRNARTGRDGETSAAVTPRREVFKMEQELEIDTELASITEVKEDLDTSPRSHQYLLCI